MNDECATCGCPLEAHAPPPLLLHAGLRITHVVTGHEREELARPIDIWATGMYLLGRNEDGAPVLTLVR